MQQADSALASGDLERADSLYYLGPRVRPRDPQMREALGTYLAAQGRTKVGIVLIEEARLFGGDAAEIAAQLAPLYQRIGDWRALLTLPRSPLSTAERRRAAWLAEHPYEMAGDISSAAMIGGAQSGDTVARVPVKIGGKSAVAALVGTDIGVVVGARFESSVRHFDGDSTVIAVDSISVGNAALRHVPASVGGGGSTVVIGVAALPATIITLSYSSGRASFTSAASDRIGTRYPLLRRNGLLQALDGKRWVPLATLAAGAQRSKSTLVIDLASGEVRIRK